MAPSRCTPTSLPSWWASCAQWPRQLDATFRLNRERHKPCRVTLPMRTIRTVVLALLGVMPVAAQAQNADAIIDRAVAAYARLLSMRAEFRQTLTNPLTGTSQTTSGVILRKNPNLLSI